MQMKLSEAIRLGAMMNPQTYGRRKRSNGNTCAYGSALEACGVKLCSLDDFVDYLTQSTGEIHALLQLFGPTMITIDSTKCPSCGELPPHGNIGGLVPHLNDVHQWARERIADFVALHEQLPVPTAQPKIESVCK